MFPSRAGMRRLLTGIQVEKDREHLGDRAGSHEYRHRRGQKAPMPVYDYPPIDLLTQGKHASVAGAEAELRESSACLLDTLDSFNIEAQIIGIVRGPSVTRFELTIPRGIKISRITALSDDIALSLGAANVRIAPIQIRSRSASRCRTRRSIPSLSASVSVLLRSRMRKAAVLCRWQGHHRQAGHR